MTAAGLSYGRYLTGPAEEWMMRLGAADAAPILFLPPLFEEMNRTRAFLATAMRALAERGFGCWLPDLPGTGESERALEEVQWSDWRAAAQAAAAHAAAASGREPLVATIRGGALLDDGVAAACRWRFAPAEGASLARDLFRAGRLSEGELQGPIGELAGYPVPEGLVADLRDARPAAAERLRTVRLESDRSEADLKVPGPALWRRSEPANSPELAVLIVSDIYNWAGQCGAS